MVTVVTREANGIPLTHEQVDSNFTGLADAVNSVGAEVIAEVTEAKNDAVMAANSANASAISAANSANAASISSGNAATSAENAALSASESASYVNGLAANDGASRVGADDGVGGSLFSTVAGFIAKIMSSAGASIIGFIQSGLGAVPRTAEDKLREQCASPEDYSTGLASGADFSDALQDAFNSGKSIWLTAGKVYGVTREIASTFPNISLTGGGTIKILPAYDVSGNTLSVLNVTGENTTIDAVVFDGTGAPFGSLNNRFVWCTAPRLKVTENASFINLPKGGTNFNGAIGCSSLAPYSKVIGAYFKGNPGAVFFQGRNCVANSNVIIDPNDVAIALNGTNCYGCTVVGNTINNEVGNSCSALIAMEEGASQWTVSGNTLFGVKDGAAISALTVVVPTSVQGGVISDNVINGYSNTTTNPSVLIAAGTYYQDVIITGNRLFGVPVGLASTTLIICAATGGIVADNLIDGSAAAGLSCMVLITPGSRGLTIKDNTSRAAAGGRHFLFQAGDYTGQPVVFKGGKFYGGAEGINAELSIASITGLQLHIMDITDNSAVSVVNAQTLLGDRAAWLNANGWYYPHHIGFFTTMHGTAIPTDGTFYAGDKVYYIAPASGGYIGAVKVASQWKQFGLVT